MRIQLDRKEQCGNQATENWMEQQDGGQMQGRFCLSWAQEMQDKLEKAAGTRVQPTGRMETNTNPDRDRDTREEYIPDSWEERDPL